MQYNMNYPTQWPGYPHHIPRIRVASKRDLNASSGPGRFAAEHGLKRSLRAIPNQARIKITERTGEHRQSITSSRRATQGRYSSPRHRDRDDLGRNPTSKPNSELLPTHRLPVTSLPLYATGNGSNGSKQYATIVGQTMQSLDGAAHSSRRRKDREAVESNSNIGTRLTTHTTHRHPRTIHLANTMNADGTRRHQVRRNNKVIARGEVYDKRLLSNPRSSLQTTRLPSRRSSRVSLSSHPRSRRSGARESWAVASATSPGRVVGMRAARRQISLLLCRSPSERAALNDFKRELEHHLVTTRAVPEQYSRGTKEVPAVVEHMSDNLYPAVTRHQTTIPQRSSRERQRNSSALVPPVKQSDISATDSVATANDHDQHSDTVSIGTTVLGFTPLDQMSNANPVRRRPTLSDHTILDFVQPHEVDNINAHVKRTRTTRQSLPWLRNKEAVRTTSNGCKGWTNINFTDNIGTTSSELVSPKNTCASGNGVDIAETILSASLYSSTASSYDRAGASVKEFISPHKDGELSARMSADVLLGQQTREEADEICLSNDVQAGRESLIYRRLPESECLPPLGRMAYEHVELDPNSAFKQSQSGKDTGVGMSASSEHFSGVAERSRIASELPDGRVHISSNYGKVPTQHTCLDRTSNKCRQCFSSSSDLSLSLLTAKNLAMASKSVVNGYRCKPRHQRTRPKQPIRRGSSRTQKGASTLWEVEDLPNVTSESSVSVKSDHGHNLGDALVFKGLHVAIAAACDEDVHVWIKDITGLEVSHILATLGRFNAVGIKALEEIAARAARHRQTQIDAWERD